MKGVAPWSVKTWKRVGNQDSDFSKGICRSCLMSFGPGFETPRCSCGLSDETPRHILIECNRFRHVRDSLRNDRGQLDFRELLTTRAGYARASRWLIRYVGLNQFRLAGQFLYEGWDYGYNLFVLLGSVYDRYRGGHIALWVLFPRGFPLGRTVEAPNRPWMA